MGKKRYSKVEEEIREILDRSDWDVPDEPPQEEEPTPIRRGWRRYRPGAPKVQTHTGTSRWSGLAEHKFWFGGTFGLALGAYVVSSWSSTIATIVAILCIIVFLSPIVRQARPAVSGPPPVEKKEWRGRVIHMPPNRTGMTGNLRYRWWKFRNRR